MATWNVSLNRAAAGELRRDLEHGEHPQLRAVAAVVSKIDPDILFVNEFDYDPGDENPRLLLQRYLPQFRHFFAAPVNTGVPSGQDLNNDGQVRGAEDAFGFGEFPGQFGMLLLSKFPLQASSARTFQKFRWRDMPDAKRPRDWYSEDAWSLLRLSSKSHWDLPVRIGRHRLHLLLSHPTPPTFDGPEDRNGRRNFDEIRLWADYLTGGAEAAYLRDDRGGRGGFRNPDAPFVLLGDLNADPVDGDSYQHAIRQLLTHPRINPAANADRAPRSRGALEATDLQGGINRQQRGDAALDTADFSDRSAGNLRIDYVLPSRGLAICDSGVFWPTADDPAAQLLVLPDGRPVSDHHLVWMDLGLAGKCKSMPTGQ